MSFKEWVVDMLGGTMKDSEGNEVSVCDHKLTVQVAIKDLAINSAINLLGNAITLSEFKTYIKGKPEKSNDYYALNVEPNPNSSASQFWKKFVYKLVFDNECLIIKINNGLYIANSFVKDEKAFRSNYYKNIIVNDFKLDAGRSEEEVFYFKLNENKIKSVVDSLFEDYGKLIEYSKKSYKRNNAKRGTMDIPTNYPRDEKSQAKLAKLLSEDIQRFYTAENGAVLPLTGGITYQDISSDSYKNATDSRDIRNLVDDIFDFVSMGFQIPSSLIKGNVANLEETVDRFIKFGVEPFTELIRDEFNRKLYKKSDYLAGTYVAIDTTRVKATNISKLANVVDVLSRNGVHSIDENRELLGKEPINSKETEKRHITKNYEEL